MSAFFGKLNPFRMFTGYFERHPWHRRFLILLPILILVSLAGPLLGIVEKLIDLAGRLLTPMFETGVGRAVLLITLLIVVALVCYIFAKERILGLFRRYALSVHLTAVSDLQLGQKDKAIKAFYRVVRLGRFIDLSAGPAAAYGSLAIDARIKLARILLAEGKHRKARAQLARIPLHLAKGRLALSLAELNARVFSGHPDHLPESVLQVLEASHKAWPGHLGISELYVEKLLDTGRGMDAARVLEETKSKTGKQSAPKVARKLAEVYLRLAREGLHAGELKKAESFLKKALRLDDCDDALLLRADIHLAKSELDAALGVLAELATPAAKERLARLLRQSKRAVAPRQLLGQVPRRDTLLTLAEYYLECGQVRKAERSLEIALRETGPSPRLLALMACLKLRNNALGDATKTLRLALATSSEQDPASPK